MKYLFLQKDVDLLKKEKDELLERHQKIGKDLMEALDQSSETWHDNAPYDDAVHNAKLTEERLMLIGNILEKAKIVEKPDDIKRVGLGCLVKVADEAGEKKNYKIGSYVSYDDSISYNCPIGSCLLDKKIGDVCVLKIGDEEKKLKILEIK